MTTRGRTLAILWLLATVLAGVLAWPSTQLDNRITAFLPQDADPALTQLLDRLGETDASRHMILNVKAADPTHTPALAAQLTATLTSHPDVEHVRSGPGDDISEQVHALFFPTRYGFLAWDEQEAQHRLLDAQLRADASDTVATLTSPMGALYKRLAPSDPQLLFQERMEALQSLDDGHLQPTEGQLMTADGQWAVLFVQTASSAFDTRATRRILQSLDEAVPPGATLEIGGMHLFADSSETLARQDATRVGLVSLLGLVLLFVALFRSVWSLPLSLLPVLVGVVWATAATSLWFGSIHGLTLAFGATLLGIGIDYPIHVLHQSASHPSGPAPFRKIVPALTLGAFTTIAGFLGLFSTTIPAVQQLAVFASAGVLAAWATTVLWVGPSLRKPVRATALHGRLVSALGGLWRRGPGGRPAGIALVLVAIGLGLAGWPRLSWTDDVAAMDIPDPVVKAQDARVRERVGQFDAGRMVVVEASDHDQLLERSQAVATRLAPLVEQGDLAGTAGLHDALWPTHVQARNLLAYQAPGVEDRRAQALDAAGLRSDAFDLSIPDTPPLTLDAVLDSPVGAWLSPFVLDRSPHTPASFVLLRQVADPSGLGPALEGLPGVTFLDRRATIEDGLARYRHTTSRRIGWGLVAVVSLMALWYRRNLRRLLTTAVPTLLAGLATLGVLGLLGQPAHLVHQVSLLLVLGIAADYAIFLSEAHARGEAGEALLAIFMAGMSTLLAFGLLALSQFPALQAVGTTVCIGVVAGWLLAPALLWGRSS